MTRVGKLEQQRQQLARIVRRSMARRASRIEIDSTPRADDVKRVEELIAGGGSFAKLRKT